MSKSSEGEMRGIFQCPDCTHSVTGPESAQHLTRECPTCGVAQEFYQTTVSGP